MPEIVIDQPDIDIVGKLGNGLWYEDVQNPVYVGGYRVSLMKIYSLGKTSRVMEISTYPRAYRDTNQYLYTEDVPFIVGEEDLNDFYMGGKRELFPRKDVDRGTSIYRDTTNHVFILGETAHHWIGEPLPGVFPKWIESEGLPSPAWEDSQKSVFPTVSQAIRGQLVSVVMHEGAYKEDINAEWRPMAQVQFDECVTVFTGTDITVAKITEGKDRTIIRISYDRMIR